MRTRAPYNSFKELHESLEYGRKAITRRSYLACSACERGNIHGHSDRHVIVLRPGTMLIVDAEGLRVFTPWSLSKKTEESIYVINLVLENFGLRWAPVNSGPNRNKIGVANKSIPYPSPRFDKAAVTSVNSRQGAVRFDWTGKSWGWQRREGWVEPEKVKVSAKRSQAAKRANYHARILGFPCTSMMFGYKMPPGLTEEAAKEMHEIAIAKGYSSVMEAWRDNCIISWDKDFGTKLPTLVYEYNKLVLQNDKNPCEGIWAEHKNPLWKEPRVNKFYQRHISKSLI